MATEIATAYISLVPSFKGGASAIASEMGGPSEKAGKDAGGRFGGAFGSTVKGLAGAGALFGGAAVLSGAFSQAMVQADLPKTLKNQFALTEDVAAEAAKAASEVYAAGWGTSLEEVGASAATVTRELEKLGETGDVTKLTTQAEALAGAFGQDVNQTILAASQLVKTGLAPDFESAFNVITAGMQSGANATDDLLDTITEYGGQFQKLGIDGPAAMGLINQGLEAGARNGDLVADAIKEFSIRAIDGSKLTSEGFDAIGLSAGDMAATIAAGGPDAATALDTVLDSLTAMEDPIARDAAAVALFGTQAEDLGAALYALDPDTAVTALGDVTTAAELTDAAGSSTSAQMTELGRSFKTGLSDALTPLIPLLQGALNFLTPLAPILGPIALAIGVVTVAQWAWNVAMLANPIGLIIILIVALIAIVVLLVKNWDTITAAIGKAWDWLKEKASAIFGAIGDAIGNAWQWIKDTTSAIWTGIKNFFSSIWQGITSAVRTHINHVLTAVAWLSALPGKVKAWIGSVRDGAVEKFQSLVTWVKGLPGKITGALGNLGSLLLQAGKDIISGLLDGIKNGFNSVKDKLGELTDLLPDWKGPPERDKNILGPAGEMVIGGFVSGLEREIPQVKSTLKRLTEGIGMDVNANLTGPQMNLSEADRELMASSGVHIDTAEFRAADNRFSLEQMRQQFAMQAT